MIFIESFRWRKEEDNVGSQLQVQILYLEITAELKTVKELRGVGARQVQRKGE